MKNHLQGIVVFYLAAKGYGYVRIPDTAEEFHFRSANLLSPVQAGDQVSFVLQQNRQGYYADQVQLLQVV